MKLTVIALFLGCSVLACKFAVQSNSLFLESSALAHFPAVRLTLARWGFEFPPAAPAPQPPALNSGKSASPPILSKGETLILIAESAAKYQVPAAFVASIVAAESNFDCTAISPKGAVGLMQLMPQTAQQFGADPAVPAQNVDVGTHYLRWLMDRYPRITHVIAAYNAGPGMVDRYRGVPPFRETRNYVRRVLGFLRSFSPAESTVAARADRPRKRFHANQNIGGD